MSTARAVDSRLAGLRAWCQRPEAMRWCMLLAVALLVARKPWALHTPQLHAEDGSIFLQQDDQLGAAALLVPYQGYLHTLPRLIAWFASHMADVRWWPAIYNGLSFLVTAGLLARFASPRLDVPGKPWLVLAFPLVAHTGEVLFNITNLQWLTAFFLLQHLLMTRPTTWPQRTLDLVILAIVGITGPFGLVFLPLFAWRAWRDFNADTLAALLVVVATSGVQTWFIAHAGLQLEAEPQPFVPKMFFAVLGSRLFVWPAWGANAARALSLPWLGIAGCGVLVALVGWALRPHPRRALRVQVLAALALITFACVYRLRPDRWETANITNGDRYFYIPRVLVAWLLIWECDAASRVVRFAARACCIVGALANLPEFHLPAPPDYHWAEHCDPIRRGVPANINTLPEGWWIEYPGRPGRK